MAMRDPATGRFLAGSGAGSAFSGGSSAGGGMDAGGISFRITLNATALRQGLAVAKRMISGFARETIGIFTRMAKVVGRVLFNMLTSNLSFIAAGVSLGGMITQFESLNQAMAASTSIMGDLSSTMVKDMRQAAIDTSKTTVFSATEAAQAYYFLASAGLDAQTSLRALPATARFAQAGMMNLAEAVDLVGGAQGALGLASKDASTHVTNMKRVMDVLARTSVLAQGSIKQFSEALSAGAGSSARLLGKDIEETSAVLAAFASQNIRGAEAGTAVSIVWRELKRLAAENAEEFKKAGVQVYDSAGRFRNTADIIDQLTKKLEGLTDLQKQMALARMGFTSESMKFVGALLGMGEAIRGYEADLRRAAGTSDEVAAKMLTPMQKAMNTLKGNFAEFSEAAAPVVEVVAAITSGAGTFLGSSTGKAFGATIAGIFIETVKRVGDGFQSVIKGALSVIHMIADTIFKFRRAYFKGDTGFGGTVLDLQEARDRFSSLPKFSDMINQAITIGQARGTYNDTINTAKGALGAAKNAPGNLLGAILDRSGGIGSAIQNIASGNTPGWGSGSILGGLFNIASAFGFGPGQLIGRAVAGTPGAIQGLGRPAAVASQRAGLAEVGTVEGYRQRVQSLAQTDVVSIAQKSLNVQEKMVSLLTAIKEAGQNAMTILEF